MGVSSDANPPNEDQSDGAGESRGQGPRRGLSEAMVIAIMSAVVSVGSLAVTTYVTLAQSDRQNRSQLSSEERKRIDETSREFSGAAIKYHAKVVGLIQKKRVKTVIPHRGRDYGDPRERPGFPDETTRIYEDLLRALKEASRQRPGRSALVYGDLPEYAAFYAAAAKVRTLNAAPLQIVANEVVKSVEPLEVWTPTKVHRKDAQWDYATLTFAPDDQSMREFEVAMNAFSIVTRNATSVE
ncbi:hypothetical protein [Actinomadura sp. WMMA1423]|uniref:hypothetical protein n=1 Tax=Actinomadura sp. WMMA1423 TaxID=2591108 RepID=UPI001146EABA|nr:hypothetical protein [Actinomadura sp. WMMA1423]